MFLTKEEAIKGGASEEFLTAKTCRCDTCLNSRVIISENGYHSVCCLSQKKAVDCITKQKDYYAENPSTRTPKERGGEK